MDARWRGSLDRSIDFFRPRHMLCAACGWRRVVDLDWIDRWEQAKERCPGCGVTCIEETAPRVTVDPNDVALDDAQIAQLAWYHTSTHPDWPARVFDPAAKLTKQNRQMMGGEQCVADWVARERAKALHIGTYEAAVHNMMRRIDDQADGESQFYLYRVRLRPDVRVREGWLIDPSDWVGDVALGEACPPGVDVARYLNYHEDLGSLSLALGRAAISATQRIAVPVPSTADPQRTSIALSELRAASAVREAPRQDSIWRRHLPFPGKAEPREESSRLAEALPVNLQTQFQAASVMKVDLAPEEWAGYGASLLALVLTPGKVLAELDYQEVRYLAGDGSPDSR